MVVVVLGGVGGRVEGRGWGREDEDEAAAGAESVVAEEEMWLLPGGWEACSSSWWSGIETEVASLAAAAASALEAAGAEEDEEGWRLRRRICVMLLSGDKPCAPPLPLDVVRKGLAAREARCPSRSSRKGRLHIGEGGLTALGSDVLEREAENETGRRFERPKKGRRRRQGPLSVLWTCLWIVQCGQGRVSCAR